ncbi:cbb3-type cytochrome c oxidase subunit I [Comamonas sp. NLF-1-9]|uniref:cbb3-type cytochrome c oxidase subunit I n=1 Tax=Comamonas sp. NLF-1-9 TaxID=2853163 RepID=UPI001C439133|nr:cbb3-type cytochrome c oxidase subunit I [Comamonas sp. NLF-1-9]
MLEGGAQADLASRLVGAAAAAVVVLGALAVAALLTRHHAWRALWRDWLTSVDHKKIGIMYVVLALVMLTRGILEAAVMRAQQAVGLSGGFLSPEHFAQLFSTHGTIMIFFMAMPFLTGLINYVVPLQIGARDVAFPLLNLISLWLTASGAMLVMVSLVVGEFSTGGWFGYPPYTEGLFTPGVGVDYWIWSLTLASLGSTLSAINIVVTIYKKRAPGMKLYCMPLFSWTALCTAIIIVFAMPPLTAATLQLALDRYLGFHFFTNALGGNQMNFANLFWLFGHPEVYVLILPAFGVYSEVFPTFSGKTLFGYKSMVWATMSIAFLSFLVWVHHFFTMGQAGHINAAFGIASMLIGIPTGVKIYDWMTTMFRGRIRLTVPMIYAIAFIYLFVIGGISGMMLANPIIDYQVHNTVFLVAHFHNMAVPGVLFGMLAGYTYWFPKAFGFRLHEGWGRLAAYCWILGWMGAFFPLYVLGLMGLPRRSVSYHDARYVPLELVALVGALLVAAALLALAVQLWVSVRQREANRVFVGDPWDGRSLEWATSAPPPEYNFPLIPVVKGRDAFTAAKEFGVGYREPPGYVDIAMPANSSLGAVFGVSGFLVAFALTWHIWWLALLALLVALAALIACGLQRPADRVIAADEVARTHKAWLAAVRAARPVARSAECSSANQGLAALETRGLAA